MRRHSLVWAFSVAIVAAVLVLAVGPSANPIGPRSAAAADDPSPRTPGLPTLKQTLADGLKASTPGEKKFVDEVVKLVHDRTLPLDMVDSTFLWARRKPTHQMEYFEQALAFRAKQIGVHLEVHLGE